MMGQERTCITQGSLCSWHRYPEDVGYFLHGHSSDLRELAEKRRLPLIDFEQEILSRRPDDWNGTLLVKDDMHPTASHNGLDASSAPTPENLRESGYLLRGWLTVRKLAELKRRVIDAESVTRASDMCLFDSR